MDKEELLKKIKTLASQGYGGEKENAQNILKAMMVKYDIKEEDLNEETIKEFDIKVKGKYEGKLLSQICFSVFGDINEKKGLFVYLRSRGRHSVHCTTSEFLEIDAKFDFFKRHLKEQMDLFYEAFVQTNALFPPAKLIKERKDHYFLSERDKQMLKLSSVMEKSEFVKQIDCKEVEE